MPVFVPATQCLPGPAPSVQFAGAVPAFATRFSVAPIPETPKIVVAESGMSEGGTVVAPLPM